MSLRTRSPRLRDPPLSAGLPDRVHVRVSAPAATLTYDSRDNVLTPTRGVYSATSYTVSREALGSTDDFERFRQTLMDGGRSGRRSRSVREPMSRAPRRAPFLLLPFVGLRGVPALRYPGERALAAEVEARWQLQGRWSLVGFGGAGRARTDRDGQTFTQGVGSGGVGLDTRLRGVRHACRSRPGAQPGDDRGAPADRQRVDSALTLRAGRSDWTF